MALEEEQTCNPVRLASEANIIKQMLQAIVPVRLVDLLDTLPKGKQFLGKKEIIFAMEKTIPIMEKISQWKKM